MAATRRSKPTFDTFSFDGSARVVVLVCKDSFLRSRHTADVVETLEREHGEIDQFEYDGETTEAVDVLDELRSVGLLHAHKLVIVDKADRFLAGHAQQEQQGSAGARKRLTAYAQSPIEAATLLLRTETWHKGKLDALIKVFKVGVENPHQAATWCRKRCEHTHGRAIEPNAADLLVRRVGLDLGRLDGEMAKLAILVSPEGNSDSSGAAAITFAHVHEQVGASREEEVWAIKAAIMLDGPDGALRAIREIFDLSRDRKDVPAFWALVELLRILHAAANLLRQDVPGNAIKRQVGIWDRSGERNTADRILAVAKRMSPGEAARRLGDVLQIQADLRRGVGDPRHALEGQTVILADRVQALAR